MTNMFLSFLEISIPISLIIAVLLLLTPFLNKRYAAKWKYWVWIALALRLMIPLGGNGGSSVTDIPPQRETLISSESEKTPPDTLADGTARGRVIIEIPAQMTTPIVIRSEKAGSNISILDITALVWMLGSLFFISVHLVSYFHYKHQILKKGKMIKNNDILLLLLKLKHELHINCTVSVIEYPEAASPLLIGFCKHILVLPKEQYNPEELFFILKHELVHLKRRDLYLKLLFAVAHAVHWFNPLIWIMQKEATVDMELSCDERVTQGTDYATRKAYTETLLSTLHKQSTKNTVLSTGFYGGKQIMKKRFINILAKKERKNGVSVLICAIMAAVSLGTLVGCSITKENTEDENNYKSILLGNRNFICTDLGNKSLNIEEIGQAVTDDDSITVSATKFTIIDLDGDGEDEVILWLQINGISDYGFEVLRYQHGEFYGYTLQYRAFMNLKTDGTFTFSGGTADSGIGRLTFSATEYSINSLIYSQSEYDANNELMIQYFANGESCSAYEFDNAVNSQEQKTDVKWYDLSDDNINSVF
ncbi:MAG: M56 family metallopeptidase [Lachnospiraceae bacterium]|nr:M56 family metallopeptidase [Lachnospiraceae bacterium]